MYISIDIGGTSTRLAACTELYQLHYSREEFKNTGEFSKDYGLLLKRIQDLSGGQIFGIGMGMPGDIDFTNNIVRSTSWNHEWENKPFIAEMSKLFSCPVYLENDAVVAAYGISFYDKKVGKDFAYVTWGSGIGGALVKDGGNKVKVEKLDWGTFFKEWESKCGGKMIERNFGAPGNLLSEENWGKVMKDFNKNMNNFIEMVNCKTLVFGGGVATKQKDRILKLRPQGGINMYVNSLNEEAGLYGGFALIRNNL